MKKLLMIFTGLMMSGQALAHPFSQEEYSLRSALTVSEKGVVPLVVLEIPIPIALRDIGATTDDIREVKKRKIKAYNEKQWSELSDNLTFMINGETPKGEWLPINHPANGKAAEGFFVYMVSYNFKTPVSVSSGMEVILENKAYPEEKMVYSGSVGLKEPFEAEMNSFEDVLGENQNLELSDPKRWTTDANLRKLELVLK
jgi:hypothetical protein